MRVPGYETGILSSYPALTCIFQKKYQATAQDVWTHAQKRRAHKTGWPRKTKGFEPEHWPKWKQFLQDCQAHQKKNSLMIILKRLWGLLSKA
ncbi:unnamed protein product [Clonostachys rosea f. rosea IK726]|uniref:Uncharacterized protein n=1 Tax=Clonostachys rosea f. rosea IK726 TaxID=1349383 RepID=A0ACA9UF02_BIOOC|nr:unnamed protein product [Clonostachys rosea f. rosea IK726]